jgi:polyphosphate glucokinase
MLDTAPSVSSVPYAMSRAPTSSTLAELLEGIDSHPPFDQVLQFCSRLSRPDELMKVLIIDVGGTHVKVLVSGKREPRQFDSGPTLTARQMVAGVRQLIGDWKYDVVSIGFPGPVLRSRPVAEPRNLGGGWVGFDFKGAFGRPLKLVNDAAMQGLGSYRHGKMLFLGLGTGLGSTLIVDGIVEPMELGHLPYKHGTYESYVGNHALVNKGKKKWRRHVADVVERLIAALEPDEVVLGGGNAKELKELPPKCRLGDNRNAFRGGVRLWQEARRADNLARTGFIPKTI